ncbi:MAG TPA: YetF domain-containing protein [Flavobacterium sp.]|nr:YetF domain-containing protein [Flavobacterium sp.]
MEQVTSIPHVILRSVAVYLFMIIALRLFGKKELSQLNPADVILILLISNSVQNAMVGTNTGLDGGLAAAVVLFSLNYLFKLLNFKFKFFNVLLEDKPEILVHEGKPSYKMLSKLNITHDELMEAVHEHGIENLSDVKLAILEMDGNISIISGDHSLRQTHYKRRKNRKNIVAM